MFKISQVPNQQTDCKLILFCSQFAILGLNILNIENLNNIVLQSVCYFGGRKILNIQNQSHKAVLKVFNILNIQNLNDIVLQSVCYFGTCKILNIQNLSHKAVLKMFHFSREPMVKWIKCQFQVQCTQVRSHCFCTYFLSSIQNKQYLRVSKM